MHEGENMIKQSKKRPLKSLTQKLPRFFRSLFSPNLSPFFTARLKSGPDTKPKAQPLCSGGRRFATALIVSDDRKKSNLDKFG